MLNSRSDIKPAWDLLGLQEKLDPNIQTKQLELRIQLNQVFRSEINQAFIHHDFPKNWPKMLANLNLFKDNSDPLWYGIICQELERIDSGLRTFFSVQNTLIIKTIQSYASPEIQSKFLSALLTCDLIGCFGLSEPQGGSDPNNMQTTAQQVEGGWILNGEKAWISNAGHSDLALIWAQTPKGIRCFLVEKDTPGFVQIPIQNKLSLCASWTGHLKLNNCLVPNQAYFEGTKKGLSTALKSLNQARYGIIWGVLGAAMDCFEIALDFVKNRSLFQNSLAQKQLVQNSLVDMALEINKAQLLNLHLAELKSKNKLDFNAVSLGKINACRQALNIARNARELLGAQGIALEQNIFRHMVNLESVLSYEGTEQIHRLILGKSLTGLSAF
ncbi:MAG: acyl-CoA dehydrogenase family protein [Gammaproteobacteria bacterium]